MGYAAELNSADSHFQIPIRIRYAGRVLNADFLLDTGATKCSILSTVNKEILKLPDTVNLHRRLPTKGFEIIILRVHSAMKPETGSLAIFTNEKWDDTKSINNIS